MAKSAVLSVGNSTSLGFLKGRISYGGMPNEQTLSLGLRQWDFIHMVWGLNLYIPVTQKQLNLGGVRLQIDEVTPTEIKVLIG